MSDPELAEVAGAEAVRDDGDVGLAEFVEADRGVEPGRAAADDDGVQGMNGAGAAAERHPAGFHRALSPCAANTASAAKTARKTRPKTMKASAARKRTAKQ